MNNVPACAFLVSQSTQHAETIQAWTEGGEGLCLSACSYEGQSLVSVGILLITHVDLFSSDGDG